MSDIPTFRDDSAENVVTDLRAIMQAALERLRINGCGYAKGSQGRLCFESNLALVSIRVLAMLDVVEAGTVAGEHVYDSHSDANMVLVERGDIARLQAALARLDALEASDD